MKGDAVVAALPQWRERIERLADQAPRKPDWRGQAAGARGAADQTFLCADQLPGPHREMKAAAAQPGSQVVTCSRPRSAKRACS